jgi:hypothetical protein
MEMFDLLNSNPCYLRHLPAPDILKTLQTAYRIAMCKYHPDKDPMRGPELAQQLNAIKEFFGGFDIHNISPERIFNSVEGGCKAWENTQLTRKTLVPQQGQLRPGSLPSDPIILDAPEITFPIPTPQNKTREFPVVQRRRKLTRATRTTRKEIRNSAC